MQLIEWILDVGLYGVNVEFAREAYVAMRSLLVGHLFLQGAMGRSCRVAAHCFYGADDLVGGDDEQWMEGAGGGVTVKGAAGISLEVDGVGVAGRQ